MEDSRNDWVPAGLPRSQNHPVLPLTQPSSSWNGRASVPLDAAIRKLDNDPEIRAIRAEMS